MIGLTKMVIGCDWFVIGFVIVIGGDCDFCDLVLGVPGIFANCTYLAA